MFQLKCSFLFIAFFLLAATLPEALLCSACGPAGPVDASQSDSFERAPLLVRNFDLSGENIRFVVRNAHDSSGVVYFNMHDNENTAVSAMDSVLQTHGGKFIELRFKGERWIGGWLNQSRHFWFDPNRIYTDLGIYKTLRAYNSYSPYSRAEVKKLANFITDTLLLGAKMIVAVHNNVKGYSIEKYMPDSLFADDAAAFHIHPKQSPHNFFYVLDSNYYQFFIENGYNAVLQSDSTFEDDGSLSVYCAQKGIPYINVEAMEGHFLAQLNMLRLLQVLIKREAIGSQKNYPKRIIKD